MSNHPSELIIVRHGESELNILHAKKREDPVYKKFIEAYKKNPSSLYTKYLANKLKNTYIDPTPDHASPLTNNGILQSEETAIGLKKEIQVPDVIFTSSYTRAMQTLSSMQSRWKELNKVEVIVENDLREQELGIVSLYGDYEIFWALNKKEGQLYALKDLYSYRFPNGENIFDVRLRLKVWYEKVCRDFGKKRILLISHFNTINSLRANFENWNGKEYLEASNNTPFTNCGVTMYTFNKDTKKMECEYYGKNFR